VVISDFIFDFPDFLTMGWMYSDAISALKKAGYTDGPMFAAAHSLGGVMLQEWA